MSLLANQGDPSEAPAAGLGTKGSMNALLQAMRDSMAPNTPYRNLNGQPAGSLVKGAPGQIYAYVLSNAAASVRFVKFYDKVTAPLVGDVPIATILLPAGASVPLAVHGGMNFLAGIGYRVTTLVADSDATAPTAGDVILNIWYK